MVIRKETCKVFCMTIWPITFLIGKWNNGIEGL